MPLAVLGVFPILWNTIRSFWIRRYLASLIPAKARKNVSLTIDPASGVVIVVLDKLGLRWQDILSRRLQHKSLAPGILQQIDPGLVGCSWMGLYEADVHVSKIGLRTQRVVVDASLRFEPLGIQCDRHTLLFLALGFGVDPYRNQLRGIPKGMLIDTEGKSVISLTAATDSSIAQLLPGLSFSERRSLAWFCIMVVRDNRGVSYIPLGVSKDSRDIDFAKPPGVTSIKENLEKLEEGGINFELAWRWICYAEAVFYDEGNQELLPVPQTLLKAREDALAKLKSLSTSDLEAHLHLIFNSDIHTISKVSVMLKRAWLDMVPEIKASKRKGQEQRARKDCQTCLDLKIFRRTSSVIQKLYSLVELSESQQRDRGLFNDDPESPMATAARIWLGLSIIQLWRREDWETELGPDGRETAKPSLALLLDILHDDEDGARHHISIG